MVTSISVRRQFKPSSQGYANEYLLGERWKLRNVRMNSVAGSLSERRFVWSAGVVVVASFTIMQNSVWYAIVAATDANTICFGAADLSVIFVTLLTTNVLVGSLCRERPSPERFDNQLPEHVRLAAVLLAAKFSDALVLPLTKTHLYNDGKYESIGMLCWDVRSCIRGGGHTGKVNPDGGQTL
jgi:hypothetical protein